MPLIKYCVDCGKKICKVSTRCLPCENVFRADKISWPSGPEHWGWKGDDATSAVKRKRGRRVFSLGPCVRCGDIGTDRHHKDGNTGNNSPSNVEILCRRCHMETDGRLDRLRVHQQINALRAKPAKPCAVCGKLSKPLRRGLCHACNERKRRQESKLNQINRIDVRGQNLQ